MDIINQNRSTKADAGEAAILVDRFMRRVHASIHRRAWSVDAERIGPFGGMILMAIADLEPVAAQDLTAHLSRDKSQMTRAVRTLETRGLVQRARSETDGRVTLLTLTDKGHAQVAAFRDVLSDAIETLLTPLDPAERTAFIQTLARL